MNANTIAKAFAQSLNKREAAAFRNFYFAACYIIDEYENEGADINSVADIVYNEGLNGIFDAGFCCFNESVKNKIQYFKFCGKEKLKELALNAVYIVRNFD